MMPGVVSLKMAHRISFKLGCIVNTSYPFKISCLFGSNDFVHMVRNHQDGYPYINLSLFFVVENIQKTLLVLKKMISQ